MGMKLNSAVLMLLLLMSITFGTACITQLASGDCVVKPMEIGLYWDQECIYPVYSIDFGMVCRGESKSLVFWLKDHSKEKGRISCGSANFNPSSNGIAESWEREVSRFTYISNWNKKMKPGDLWKVIYTIEVAPDIQTGAYSWDLLVCFIVSHKITCLVVHCFLEVTQ